MYVAVDVYLCLIQYVQEISCPKGSYVHKCITANMVTAHDFLKSFLSWKDQGNTARQSKTETKPNHRLSTSRVEAI